MILHNLLLRIGVLAFLIIGSIACQDKIEETAHPTPLPSATYSTDDPGYTLAQSLANAM